MTTATVLTIRLPVCPDAVLLIMRCGHPSVV
jgi:hypothetical protein